MHGELHVGAAGFHAHDIHDLARPVTELLILGVGESDGRGHGHAVAGVDSHGIKVLDAADYDKIVCFVANDFDFILFPAGDRLFHQDLGYRRFVESVGHHGSKFSLVMGESASGAAQGVGGPDDQRIAVGVGKLQRFVHRVCDHASGHVEPCLRHGFSKFLTIFGQSDRFEIGTKKLHSELFQDSLLG